MFVRTIARLANANTIARASLVASARRTFLSPVPYLSLSTTVQRQTPPTNKTTTTEAEPAKTKKRVTTKRKPAAKAQVKTKTKKSVAKKPKPKAKKQVVAKKPKRKPKLQTRFTASERPPKPPPNLYVIFILEYLKQHGKPTSLTDANQRFKEAAQSWSTLTSEQKQPYLNEYALRRKEYLQKRADYFATVDPKLLRALNKMRVAKGKSRIRRPRPSPEHRRPLNRFMNFVTEFRKSPESEKIIAESGHRGGKTLPMIVTSAAAKWNALSEEEKSSYKTPRV